MAALALATATPTIVKTFPDSQLGLALGINAISWIIGAIIGPVVGGILITQFGWRSIFFVTVPFVFICIIGAVLLCVTFIITELHVENPLFNLNLLSYRKYSIGLGITLCYCIAYFSLPLLLSVYLQSALHLSPTMSGVLMISLSVPQLILGPFAGKVVDYMGSVKTLSLGIIFLIIGIFMLGNLGAELSIPTIVTPLILLSIANSLA